MEGVTSAIVAFLFVCIVFPRLVKNKPQYYGAFAAILVVILLSGLERVIATTAFLAFTSFATAVLQIVAMILLILAAGGLTWRQLVGDVTEAIDAVRHGAVTEKDVHLRGQAPPAGPTTPGPQDAPPK